MRVLFTTFLLLFTFEVSANDNNQAFNSGDNWILDSRSNRLSADAKVLYYMPNDAYYTKNARDFGDWDIFSIVDSRDVESLSKGDIIQIIEAKYNENVFKVKLLTGFNRNKTYFVIADDLRDHFKPFKESIDD